MSKPVLLCLCLGWLVGCQAPVDPWLLNPPQVLRPDAAKGEFFGRIHYPYYASRTRRRIERIVRGLTDIQTPAQVLAELGPPEWKTEGDGYPPKVPPYEIWYYMHTLEWEKGDRHEWR